MSLVYNEPSTIAHRFQLQEVQAACRTLLPTKRASFLENLARRVGDQPTNEALSEAISAVLANRLPSFCGPK